MIQENTETEISPFYSTHLIPFQSLMHMLSTIRHNRWVTSLEAVIRLHAQSQKRLYTTLFTYAVVLNQACQHLNLYN